MTSSKIEIKPIGGLYEIGSNMILVSCKDEKVVIDCGILFPDDDSFGINYLIPNFKELEDVSAIVFTHGHEDHIGACSYFFDQFPQAKVHASAFTAELIDRKMNFLGKKKNIQLFTEESCIEFQNFNIYPIRVNHSIPETFGLLIQSKDMKTSIFYVSDFKVDSKSPYEKPFDFERLVSLSKESEVRLLMPDSTNILSSNEKTPSEGELVENVQNIVSNAKGNVFITTFASNIHRLQTILDSAKKTNRKVVLSGRSMLNYSAIAGEQDLLKGLNLVVDAEKMNSSEKYIIVLSGCQGDFKSALKRVSNKKDKYLKLRSEDTFIYSAKAIPGNEIKVSKTLNQISEITSNIFIGDKDGVHASGHAGKEDLRKVIKQYKPTHYCPVHGEVLFLKKHNEFINKTFPKINTIFALNHSVVEVSDEVKSVLSNEEFEPILISGNSQVIDRALIRERRKIAEQGIIFISYHSNKSINVDSLGVPEENDFLKKIFNLTSDIISKNKKLNQDKLKEEIRVAVRRFSGEEFGFRPVCIVQDHQ